MYTCVWLSHKHTPKHTFDGAKVHKLSVNMGKNKRFIAIIQRNMEKAMRHVRPPITLTPILYIGVATWQSADLPMTSTERHGEQVWTL